MTTYLTALTPIISLILLGYVLKRIQFISNEAWSGMERLTYYVLFPALLISTLGKQSIGDIPWQSIMIASVATLLITAVVLIAVRPLLTTSGSLFTSIFQGGIRFNTYIMFAVAFALFGERGLEVGSVAAGFMIVLINLLCIIIFAIWGKCAFQGYRQIFKELIANPLIIGCMIGWALSLTGIGLPGVTADIMEIIGRATLPFGLLAVGAGLRIGHMHNHLSAITYSSLAQFGLKPLLVITIATWLSLDDISTAVLVISFMVPTASSAYILAKQLGGDTDAMASIITAQTILGFLLMPLIGALLL